MKGRRTSVEGRESERSLKSPRERAARALCRKAGNPEDSTFEGRPMWMSYLEEADTVLQAALSPGDWDEMRQIDTKARY
ncbi:hypothetical protein MJC1_04222 [Methylocystis sp. MJC1]|nr:hypothetical protein MJC1_04222 [Methylocystis sp. MJC1]